MKVSQKKLRMNSDGALILLRNVGEKWKGADNWAWDLILHYIGYRIRSVSKEWKHRFDTRSFIAKMMIFGNPSKEQITNFKTHYHVGLKSSLTGNKSKSISESLNVFKYLTEIEKTHYISMYQILFIGYARGEDCKICNGATRVIIEVGRVDGLVFDSDIHHSTYIIKYGAIKLRGLMDWNNDSSFCYVCSKKYLRRLCGSLVKKRR